VTGITVNDGNSGGNYVVGYVDNTTSTITAANLFVTGQTAGAKIYDGSPTAHLSGGSLSGIIEGDTVSLTQAGAFTSQHAGTGIAVTAADSLGGPSASDYMITQPTGLSANITPAHLGVNGTMVGNKVYDGTTAAPLTGGTLSGVIGGDNVLLNQAGRFASRHAGSAIEVAAADSIDGPNANDYTITQPVGLAGTITPATLSVNGTTIGNKIENGTASAPLMGGRLVGVVAGDAVSLDQAGIFASTNAGSGIAVTATDSLSGASAGDYNITQPMGLTGTILPASSNSPGTPDAPVSLALNARNQLESIFAAPQFGAVSQLARTSSSFDELSTGAENASARAESSALEYENVAAIAVSTTLGATGTLRIVNGGLRLPGNLASDDE
jgi:hypothetical protein